MNYQLVYSAIIRKWQSQAAKGYSEKHHIVPKCIGGTDAPENFVRLPARAHFVAHLLLAKIHGGKLLHAAYRMSNYEKYGSRRYEWLRRRNAEAQRGNKHSLGVRPSAETRAKLSAARIGNQNAKGNKDRSAWNKGKKMRPGHGEGARLANLGIIRSAETRSKMSAAQTGNQKGAHWKGKKRGSMSAEHKEKIALRMREIRATKKWKSRFPRQPE